MIAGGSFANPEARARSACATARSAQRDIRQPLTAINALVTVDERTIRLTEGTATFGGGPGDHGRHGAPGRPVRGGRQRRGQGDGGRPALPGRRARGRRAPDPERSQGAPECRPHPHRQARRLPAGRIGRGRAQPLRHRHLPGGRAARAHGAAGQSPEPSRLLQSIGVEPGRGDHEPVHRAQQPRRRSRRRAASPCAATWRTPRPTAASTSCPAGRSSSRRGSSPSRTATSATTAPPTRT